MAGRPVRRLSYRRYDRARKQFLIWATGSILGPFTEIGNTGELNRSFFCKLTHSLFYNCRSFFSCREKLHITKSLKIFIWKPQIFLFSQIYVRTVSWVLSQTANFYTFGFILSYNEIKFLDWWLSSGGNTVQIVLHF